MAEFVTQIGVEYLVELGFSPESCVERALRVEALGPGVHDAGDQRIEFAADQTVGLGADHAS